MNTLQDLHKVWEIKTLKKPLQEDALKILDKIAKQVQPIMRRRKWRVKLLSEFCPTNPALLGINVNSGVAVKLRLRRPNRDLDFIPYEQVLDTMLHELCHIQHGPHNAQFYKLWDELRLECEELVSKGITGTGQGFDTLGKRLGGYSRQPPLSSLRQTAAAAAAKRARIGALLPSGPRRLGGDNEIMTALTPTQAAAMAAERRMQDELWCASGFQENVDEVESENGKLEPSSFIDLDESFDIPDDIQGRKDKDSSTSSIFCGKISGVAVRRGSSAAGMNDFEDEAMWECSVCTLFNQPLALVCEACGVQKPVAAATKFKTWSCKICTLQNDSKLDKCAACDEWRYSYGPPASTRAPNYGT